VEVEDLDGVLDLLTTATGRGGGENALRASGAVGGAKTANEGDPERGWPIASKAFAFVTVDPSFFEEPTCDGVVLPRDGNSKDFPDGGENGRVKFGAVGVVPK